MKDLFSKSSLKIETKPTVGIEEMKIDAGNEGQINVWDVSGKEECMEWLPNFLPKEVFWFHDFFLVWK